MNEFLARNGLISKNNVTITGSLTVTGTITGSFSGSGTVTTSSFSSTASYVNPLTQNVTVVGSIFSSGSTSTIPLIVTDGPASFGAWNKTMMLRSIYPSLIFNSNSSKWTGIGYDYSSGFNIWVNASSEDIYSTYPKFSIYNNGNVGINNQFPSYTLDVSGSTRITNGLTVTGNTFINNYLNVGSIDNIDLAYDIYGRGGMGFGSTINVGNTSVNRNLRILSPTDGGNGTVSIGYFKSAWLRAFTIDNSPTTPAVWLQPDGGNVTIGTTTDPGDRLFVSGSTRITGGLILTGSISPLSSSLYIYKSGSTTVDIQGSQGQLFSITDNLTGSLMSVNDVSGLPILEVFSNDTVVMGTYNSPAVVVSGSTTVTSGSLRGKVNTLPITSNTASMDCSLGNFFDLTLVGGFTTFLSASNIQPGQTLNLRVTQPTTSGSLTYGSNFKFAGGIPYSASSTGSVVDLISFISYDTSTLYGSAIKNLS